MKSFVPLVAALAFAVAGAVPVPQMPPSPFGGMPMMPPSPFGGMPIIPSPLGGMPQMPSPFGGMPIMPSPLGGMPQMPSPFGGMGGMPMMPPSPFGGMPQLPPWLMQMFFQMMMNGAQPANMSTLPVNPESEDPTPEDPTSRVQVTPFEFRPSFNLVSTDGNQPNQSTSPYNNNLFPLLWQMFANGNPFAVPSITG